MAGHFPRKRYVSLGGGTGQSQVIRALRMLDCEISAVVAMADDGGSTGVIRREMGVVPPGDVRNCLVALAADPMGPVARAFQRRLPVASDHALGNLILATLDEECDSFVDAIEMCERMLGCVGSVLPSTQEFVALRGITCDGRPISGEELIGTSPCTIGRVCLEPERPEACPEAVAAILSADVIVMGPGSLFTSIIPNVLVPGIARALHDTSATRIFVCPKADTQYETWGLTADEYVRALYDHGAEGCVDAVLVHRARANGSTSTRAFEALTAEQIAADQARRAFYASRRPPFSENVLPHVHDVRVDDAIIKSLERMVPVVAIRDFNLADAPTAHDPAKLAGAIEAVSGCRLRRR